MLGIAFGMWWAGRRDGAAPADAEPTSGLQMVDLLERVFRSAEEGLVVLTRFGEVVLHNERAVELGVIRNGRPDARAEAACQQVLQTGTPTAVDLSPLDHNRGRQPAAVLARVRPLGDGFAMVEAADTSEAV